MPEVKGDCEFCCYPKLFLLEILEGWNPVSPETTDLFEIFSITLLAFSTSKPTPILARHLKKKSVEAPLTLKVNVNDKPCFFFFNSIGIWETSFLFTLINIYAFRDKAAQP